MVAMPSPPLVMTVVTTCLLRLPSSGRCRGTRSGKRISGRTKIALCLERLFLTTVLLKREAGLCKKDAVSLRAMRRLSTARR